MRCWPSPPSWGQFRGESRFTTWPYKFILLEVSAKTGQHFWRRPEVRWNAEDRDRLPGRFGFEPAGNPSGGICLPRCAAPWAPS
jgi:hypothetical protein